jgi:hypothetical protein
VSRVVLELTGSGSDQGPSELRREDAIVTGVVADARDRDGQWSFVVKREAVPDGLAVDVSDPVDGDVLP